MGKIQYYLNCELCKREVYGNSPENLKLNVKKHIKLYHSAKFKTDQGGNMPPLIIPLK